MNILGKIIVFFILLILVVPYGISQETERRMARRKFYSIEANFGMSARPEFTITNIDYENFRYSTNFDEAKFSYKTLVYGCNFIRGIRIRGFYPTNFFKVGLGTGYLYYKQKDGSLPYKSSFSMYPNTMTTHGIPLFFYLRNDFSQTKVIPYIDFKVGNNFLITKETVDMRDYAGNSVVLDYGKFRLKNGLYLASNIGVTFNINQVSAISLSIGYQYVSRNCDLYYDKIHTPFSVYDPLEPKEYIKTGYTAIDHQFMFNVGFSF